MNKWKTYSKEIEHPDLNFYSEGSYFVKNANFQQLWLRIRILTGGNQDKRLRMKRLYGIGLDLMV